MKAVGFLFNHYTGHQMFHSLPIAFAMAQRGDCNVKIIVSNPSFETLARTLQTYWEQKHGLIAPDIITATVPRWVDLADPLLKQFLFVRKKAVLDHNIGLFKSLDALVVPEKNSLALKKHSALKNIKFIRIRHGAGDRATGLDESNKEFDLVLTSGAKMQNRLIRDQKIPKEKLPIIGYPKFDMINCLPAPKRLFDNDRPTVIYNPHFRRGESSWIKMGKRVLDFFKENTDYNLIFAPHILLYQRGIRHGAKWLGRYKSCPNIHIDVQSNALIDMTYTLQADIYLGDVSSQIYEFLKTPKPCIFLNAHRIHNWRKTEIFTHWQCGEVIDSPSHLKSALSDAHIKHQGLYKNTQINLTDKTFANLPNPSATAAKEILKFLNIKNV